MKVAIYARVSKDETASDGSLQNPDNQLIPLRKYCEAREFEVVEEFVDRASGGSANRPQFQRMLSMVRQCRFKAIIVWRLDRFSREGMSSTLSYIKQLKKYNCGLMSLQETWLDTTQEGICELVLGIMSWAAAEDRKKISENTIAGLEKRRQDIRKYGYFLNRNGKRTYKLGRPYKEKKT